MEHHFIEHRTNSNNIFQTSNELDRVHLLVIEHEHTIFGFKQRTSNLIVLKLLIELTQTSFFLTLNVLELVHLLVIELEHLIFGLK